MRIFGFDIGNGFGYAAALDSAGDPRPCVPPSMVEGMPTEAYVDEGGKIVVNGPASLAARHPERAVRAIKTQLRDSTVTRYGPDGRPVFSIPPHEIYRAIAAKLLELACRNLPKDLDPDADGFGAVVTYPALFEDSPGLLAALRQDVESIAAPDGKPLRVVGMLPEPAAAIIDYLHSEAPRASGRQNMTVLVYDLGHGTYDTAVVRLEGSQYQVLEKDGITDIGGRNFDALLEEMIAGELKSRFGYEPLTANERDLILREAVSAKHALTDAGEYTTSPFFRNEDSFTVTVTRAQFEERSRTLLLRTLEATAGMLDRLESMGGALSIDRVILTGGGSQMPMVKSGMEALMRERTQTEIPVIVHRPSAAVAYGAALFAKADVVQYTAFSYGIRVPSGKDPAGTVKIVVPKGARIPARSAPVLLRKDGTRLVVRVEQTGKPAKADQEFVPGECLPVQWFYFDVPGSAACPVVLAMEQVGSLSVSCTLPDGSVQRQTARVAGAKAVEDAGNA